MNTRWKSENYVQNSHSPFFVIKEIVLGNKR